MTVTDSAAGHPEISAPALGMILFISSEVMFFAGLFAAYFTIRSGTASWPPPGTHLELVIPAAATALLLASSITMHRAVAAADEEAGAKATLWLLLTIGLGTAFLIGQGIEYSQLSFTPADHSYGTLFYSMTGFHGLHVFAGLVTLTVVSIKNRRAARLSQRGPIAAAGLYWHFVDVVWVLLFATLYLLR